MKPNTEKKMEFLTSLLFLSSLRKFPINQPNENTIITLNHWINNTQKTIFFSFTQNQTRNEKIESLLFSNQQDWNTIFHKPKSIFFQRNQTKKKKKKKIKMKIKRNLRRSICNGCFQQPCETIRLLLMMMKMRTFFLSNTRTMIFHSRIKLSSDYTTIKPSWNPRIFHPHTSQTLPVSPLQEELWFCCLTCSLVPLFCLHFCNKKYTTLKTIDSDKGLIKIWEHSREQWYTKILKGCFQI